LRFYRFALAACDGTISVFTLLGRSGIAVHFGLRQLRPDACGNLCAIDLVPLTCVRERPWFQLGSNEGPKNRHFLGISGVDSTVFK
jgi:hypothetical protein